MPSFEKVTQINILDLVSLRVSFPRYVHYLFVSTWMARL